MTTRAQIVELLKTRDAAVARALVVLTQRQTVSEQATESTQYRNGEGFRPCHARMGTSMANFYQRRGYLSPKQIAYWRQPMKDGKMRIEIYAGQLLAVARARAAAKTSTGSRAQQAAARDGMRRVNGEFEPQGDVGNLREELMVLEERAAQEKDPETLDRMHDRMIQIRDQIDEIYRCEYRMSRDAA